MKPWKKENKKISITKFLKLFLKFLLSTASAFFICFPGSGKRTSPAFGNHKCFLPQIQFSTALLGQDTLQTASNECFPTHLGCRICTFPRTFTKSPRTFSVSPAYSLDNSAALYPQQIQHKLNALGLRAIQLPQIHRGGSLSVCPYKIKYPANDVDAVPSSSLPWSCSLVKAGRAFFDLVTSLLSLAPNNKSSALLIVPLLHNLLYPQE